MEAEKQSKSKGIDQTDKQLAAIGYLWVFCILPLLKKKSKFAQFHGKQGLLLLVAWFFVWTIGWIPILGWFVGFFGHILLFTAMYYSMRTAMRGEYWEIPVLGEYAKKLNL